MKVLELNQIHLKWIGLWSSKNGDHKIWVTNFLKNCSFIVSLSVLIVIPSIKYTYVNRNKIDDALYGLMQCMCDMSVIALYVSAIVNRDYESFCNDRINKKSM